MIRKACFLIFVLQLFAITSFAQAPAGASGRKTLLFNENWKFFKGDSEKAFEVSFDDKGWRNVELPHDYSVEGPFDSQWASATGYLPTGIAWYRKTFVVPASDKGKQVAIYFEGVSKNGEVWINGHYLGKRPNGYISYQYDLTPYLNIGKQNVLAVKVDHQEFADSRWYAGSGIYRNVYLIATNKIHIKQWGVFATTPVINKDKATVAVNVSIENNAASNQKVEIENKLADQNGKLVARNSKAISVAASNGTDLDLSMEVLKPNIWSIDHPNLYTLTTTIKQGTVVLDEIDTKIGIRSFHFDADKGFTLNGVPMKLKGVCVHHDAGCLGAAVPNGMLQWRVDMAPIAGVINQNHGCYGDAAEYIQREQPGGFGKGCGHICYNYLINFVIARHEATS